MAEEEAVAEFEVSQGPDPLQHGVCYTKKTGPLSLYLPIQLRQGKPPIPAHWVPRHALIRDGDLLFFENSEDEFPTEFARLCGATFNEKNFDNEDHSFTINEAGGEKWTAVMQSDANVGKEGKLAWLLACKVQPKWALLIVIGFTDKHFFIGHLEKCIAGHLEWDSFTVRGHRGVSKEDTPWTAVSMHHDVSKFMAC
jgi:hypothetical protein